MSRMAWAWSSDRSKPRHEVVARVLDVGRLADRLDDRVEVVERDLEALEDVGPGARLAEVELGPPPDDLAAVVDVVLRGRAFSGSVWGWPSTSASMFMLNASCIGVCLNRLFSTLCGLASRLISMKMRMPSRSDSSRRSAMPSIRLSLTRSAIFSSRRRLVHLVRQLGDDDRRPVAADLLERDLGAHHDPAAAVGVHLADRVDRLPLAGERVALLLEAEDRAAGREVRALDVLAQVVGR